MRRLIAPVVTGLIGVLIGGATVAFAVGTTGVISACFNQTNGNLRVVDAGAACRTGESPISWNASGGAGAVGATGASGPAGAAGPQGATGASGANGTDGTNGSNGVDGAVGATGAVGTSGAQGPKGDTGVAGATGPQGPAGAGGAGSPTLYLVTASIPLVGPGGSNRAECNPGDELLSGGYSNPWGGYIGVNESRPIVFINGTAAWEVGIFALPVTAPPGLSVSMYALCAH